MGLAPSAIEGRARNIKPIRPPPLWPFGRFSPRLSFDFFIDLGRFPTDANGQVIRGMATYDGLFLVLAAIHADNEVDHPYCGHLLAR